MTSPFYAQKQTGKQKELLKLGLFPSMQQALQVLQMPIEELTAWLNLAITQNPLLEWEEDPSPQEKKLRTSSSSEEIAHRPSLFTHLMNQVSSTLSDKHLLQIAEWIIGNLDPTGFFTLSFSEVPFPCELRELNFCLEKIKQLDPPGVGAKNIEESLLLQLKAEGKENSPCFSLLSSKGLEGFLAGNKALIRELSGLDPFPGHKFAPRTPSSLLIDVIFTPEEISCPVEVLTPLLPKSVEFCLESFSKEEKAFCREHQLLGKQIIEAVKKRSKTLQKITRYLVKKQKDYLEGNCDTLEPLSIRMIAEELSLHESTIARALANKNLSCPRGVMPLKSLLSSELSEDVSCDKAKKLLKKLIREENKQSPLSDQELLKKMHALGVLCARRTLSKYRKSLKIPPKHGRKKLF